MSRRLLIAFMSARAFSLVPACMALVFISGLFGSPGLASAQPSIRMITTVAGTGVQGFSGDGGPATAAQVTNVFATAVDSAGNLYLADSGNNRIRKVDRLTGIITTIAGNGAYGSAGDGGPALDAELANVYAMAFDADDNLYISDGARSTIRRIAVGTHTITTIAGNGTSGFSGDGGQATDAQLTVAWGLATGGSVLYIADGANYRVRKVDLVTGIITTAAGDGTPSYGGDGGAATAAQLGYPYGVAVDGGGNLYIADGGSYTIRRVDAGSGIITTVAGNGTYGDTGDGGPATSAQLWQPSGVAVDALGNLYIADSTLLRIRVVNGSTGVITTIAGAGSSVENGIPASESAPLRAYMITSDRAGNLVFGDEHRVRSVTSDVAPATATQPGNQSVLTNETATFTTAITGVPAPAIAWQFSSDGGTSFVDLVESSPYGGVATPTLTITGTPFSLNGYLYRVRAINIWGESFSNPASLTVTKRTPTITWASPAQMLPGATLDGTQLNATASVAGTLVYDPPAGTVMAAGTAQLLKVTFTPADAATYLVVVKYVVLDVIGADNEGALMIGTIAGTGATGYSGDGGPATLANLRYPQAVTIDNAGNVYIPDMSNQRIRKVDAITGIITTVAGIGTAGFNGDGLAATATQLNGPIGIVFDGAGNLFFADYANHRVRRIDAGTGVVTTVAGTGVSGFDGEDGPATAAALREPRALAFDAAGNLYIADGNGSLIRRVSATTGMIAMVAGYGPWNVLGDGGPAIWANIAQATALAFDDGGNLFISDYGNNRIRRIDADTGIITTVVGHDLTWAFSGDGGLPTEADLAGPFGVDVDTAGNLYIADGTNNRIRKVTAVTGLITSIAGSGVYGLAGDGGLASAAEFRTPYGVTWAGGALFVNDSQSQRIRKIANGARPSFTPQPADMSTSVGGSVVFTAGVAGFPPPTLKWQVSSNGTTWNDLTNTAPYSGVATSSLTITGADAALDGLQYQLVATNSIAASTSHSASLTVTTSTLIDPVITWANPTGIVYGTALGATQLNATADTPGTFVYTPLSGTLLTAGSHTLSVTFTPNDAAHYNTVTDDVTIVVSQATPVVTWANPAGIVYGAALGATQLNATANVAGAFVYTPAAGAVLSAGPHTLSTTFTPTDAVNYAAVPATASILVSQATPTITWATPAMIVYGTPLGGTQLNATASTAGTFAYSQASGTVLGAGSHSITADFTPTDPVNYTTATATVTLGVLQATPVITWASPAPIAHYTALGPTQLNATANVPGTFVYYPAAGSVLPIGAAQELRAYFTPTDIVNYAYVTTVTTIDVNPAGPIITTIAGINTAGGFSGDGGQALAAEFQQPSGLAVDLAGNVYVADQYNYRVRKVTAATGVISTVAGSGNTNPAEGGYGGDGGPATSAQFWWTNSVAVDGAGNLYVSDPGNRRIRKVTAATGVVTTVAGNGLEGFSGDGGPATSARLGYATGIARDRSGNLYIADYTNNRVRKVSAATGIITTVAGSGVGGFLGDGGPATEARLYNPYRVALDLAGNLYIADTYNERIRKVTVSTGIITTIAGTGVADFGGDGGPATEAMLDTPTDVAVDGAGHVYILDAGNYRIRKIDADTGIMTTVAGTGIYNSGAVGDGEEATHAGLGALGGMAIDAAGNLYLAGSDSNRIRKITAQGAPSYWLTITPAPTHGNVLGGGINCGTGGTACQAGFANFTAVTVTAAPDPDYLFTGWGGGCSGTDPTATIDVRAATTCTATFAPSAPPDGPPYTMTITMPTGGKILGAGLNCGAGGTSCSVTMPGAMRLGIEAAASAGYTFTAWTGDCSGATPALLVSLNGPRTCGAVFTPVGGTPDFELTIAPTPGGGLVTGGGFTCGAGGTTCQIGFGSATSVTLTAAPNAGFAFTAWGGACSGTNTTTTILVDGVRTCSATFTATGGGPVNGPPYTMTVSMPTGGKVLGAGLNCGVGSTACSVTMPGAMSLGIEAVASAGYTFTAWTGDCAGSTPTLSVALNGARTCGAVFTLVGGTPQYQLTIAPTPSGGIVTGGGFACGAGGTTCQLGFGTTTTVTLTATPSPGYVFSAWGGACGGAGTSINIQAITGVHTCSATFAPAGGGPVNGPPYTMTITLPVGGKVLGAGLNCGAGGTACSVTMPGAMTLGLEANASAGYSFTAWTGDCSGAAPTQSVALNGPRTCGAIFTPAGGTPDFQLMIAPPPTGGEIRGGGLACQASGFACAVGFASATTVTLTATPNSGYAFTSWGGACSGTAVTTTVLVNAALTCSATFTATGGGPVNGPPYTMTIVVPTGGKVLGAGLNCGAGGTTCSVTMPGAMRLGLEAQPSAGYSFGGWTGDCSGSSPAYLISLNGPRTCGATFVVR